MKKIFPLFIVLLVTLSTSCKKNAVTEPPGCEQSVIGVAGNYKLTKLVAVSGSTNTDLTTTIPPCEINALYQFNVNKSTTYTEYGTCTNSSPGSWDIVGGRIYATIGNINFQDCNIANACTTLSVTEPGSSGEVYITTFTRQ